MWYFGLLVFQMCTLDGETVWKSSQADNLVDNHDLKKLAYHFETMKLDRTQRILRSSAVHPVRVKGPLTMMFSGRVQA